MEVYGFVSVVQLNVGADLPGHQSRGPEVEGGGAQQSHTQIPAYHRG